MLPKVGINNFIHVIINAHDLHLAHRFYGSMFNWSLSEIDEQKGQILFQVSKDGDFMSGSINLVEKDIKIRSGVILYVNVDNLEGSRDQIADLGGKILEDIFTLEGVPGRIVVFEDPFGNLFGLWSEN